MKYSIIHPLFDLFNVMLGRNSLTTLQAVTTLGAMATKMFVLVT